MIIRARERISSSSTALLSPLPLCFLPHSSSYVHLLFCYYLVPEDLAADDSRGGSLFSGSGSANRVMRSVFAGISCRSSGDSWLDGGLPRLNSRRRSTVLPPHPLVGESDASCARPPRSWGGEIAACAGGGPSQGTSRTVTTSRDLSSIRIESRGDYGQILNKGRVRSSDGTYGLLP